MKMVKNVKSILSASLILVFVISNSVAASSAKKPAPKGTKNTQTVSTKKDTSKDKPKTENKEKKENVFSAIKDSLKKKDTIHDTENWDIASLDTARNVDYLSDVEKDVILEMNKARSNPKKYAELYIVPLTKKYRADKTYQKNGKTILTNEGVSAVNECISAMSKTAAMKTLEPKKGLSLAAQKHAISQSKTNEVGHVGVDGSDPFTRIREYGSFTTSGENISYGDKNAQDIVVSLLIDDGVPSRGHRKNILNKTFTQTGCGFAPQHKAFGAECVITYASEFSGD